MIIEIIAGILAIALCIYIVKNIILKDYNKTTWIIIHKREKEIQKLNDEIRHLVLQNDMEQVVMIKMRYNISYDIEGQMMSSGKVNEKKVIKSKPIMIREDYKGTIWD